MVGKIKDARPQYIHIHDIFGTNKTEAVLLVDAENAFNSINRQVFCITSNIYVHL